MRPLAWQNQLRADDLTNHPVLALLAPIEVALEALVLALRAQHPQLTRHPPLDHTWDLDLRRAQTIAALSHALQSAIVDYHQDQLSRVREANSADIPY